MSKTIPENYKDGEVPYSDLISKTFWDFLRANPFLAKDVDKSVFKNETIKSQELERYILNDYDFSGADLLDVSFKGSDLKRANFNECKITWCDFRGANLEGATFENAVIRERPLLLRAWTKLWELFWMTLKLIPLVIIVIIYFYIKS